MIKSTITFDENSLTITSNSLCLNYKLSTLRQHGHEADLSLEKFNEIKNFVETNCEKNKFGFFFNFTEYSEYSKRFSDLAEKEYTTTIEKIKSLL